MLFGLSLFSFLYANFMLFLTLISLSNSGISFVRFSNFNDTKRDPASLIFNNYYLVNSTSSFLKLLPNITTTKWIFMSDFETAISPGYIKYILSMINNRNTIIGRFGCIPTSSITSYNVTYFKLCYKYPILQSGFAISSDFFENSFFKSLINAFNSKNRFFNQYRIEYLIGLGSEYNSNCIDDFRFSYFTSYFENRQSLFLPSFYPRSSSNLDIPFIHASGITFTRKVSPFMSAEIVLGVGIKFNNSVYEYNDHVKIECLNNGQLDFDLKKQSGFNDDKYIKLPPMDYVDPLLVQVYCF